MESSLSYLLDIGIVLLAANLGGIVSKKFNQPAVLGQIVAGVILGLGIVEKTEIIEVMGELGVIFLMFIAGLETDVDELKASGGSSATIAIGGVVFPLLFVVSGIYLFTKDIQLSVFMGIVSTATSVSISVQTLREMGKLNSRQGIGILGAAIIDDIVGIILLTLVVGIFKPGEGSNLIFVLLKIVSFFILTFAVGYVIIKLVKRFVGSGNLDDKIVSYAIIGCFLLAFSSEELGVAAITGAYFSGVVFSMTSFRHKIAHDISSISGLLFTPVFFVGIGMGVELGSAFLAIGIGSVFLVLAVLGKIVGSGLGAKLTGFNNKASLQIGIGMVPRAEVAIIIANLGLKLNLIGEKELAAVILTVLITTLVTPSMLKAAFKGKKAAARSS
ncbi:MAG: cation:proton antiporter [Firmicutes bacterium]|nr:cation:proton antiporter [Bacillota bacterium]